MTRSSWLRSTKCRWWTDAAPQGWTPAVLELEQSGTDGAQVEFGQLSVYVSGEKTVRPETTPDGVGWIDWGNAG